MKLMPYTRSGNKNRLCLTIVFSLLILITSASRTIGQEVSEEDEDNIIELSPFEVSSEGDVGYLASSTLAGTRLRTNLEDVGSSISVLTEEFMDDLGAYDNQGILAYTSNIEVSGPQGNFLNPPVSAGRPQEQGLFNNPNQNNRIRGLQQADSTRDFFITEVPWDGYNVSRVDIQRGPNAILFGLGSPAGIINASPDKADVLGDKGELKFRFDQFGSARASLNYNKVVLENQLAVRVAALHDEQKFRQKPAFEDDERLYAAFTWQPAFLNNKHNRFTVSANYEKGDIEGNRPRFTTPIDFFTAFLIPVEEGGQGGQTFNLFAVNDGQVDPGDPNDPTYNPWNVPMTFAPIASNPRIVANSAGPENSYWSSGWLHSYGALDADGNPGSNADLLYGSQFRGNGIASYSQYALNTGVPYASDGFVYDKGLSDPSIYDFYNWLMDGDNKREFMEWDVYSINISDTVSFGSSRVGVDFAYFEQDLEMEQRGILWWENRIFVDVDEVEADGSPNPNLGRAYVQEWSTAGNSARITDRDSWRIQGFLEHDFNKKGDSLWTKLIGLQRLTGSLLNQREFGEFREFNRFTMGEDYRNRVTGNNMINNTNNRLGVRYYISDDLRGRNLADGLHLSNIQEKLFEERSQTVSMRYFDTTWAPPAGVEPGHPWGPSHSDYPATADPAQWTTQSQNPNNYVGWTTGDFEIISPFSGNQADRDYATRTAVLNSFKVDSTVFVWQGYLWEDSIVGMYGYRKDEAVGRTLNGPVRPDGGRNVDPSVYDISLAPRNRLEVVNRNWSVVTHFHKLFPNTLPVGVSLFYNEGSNFQPAAGRIDYMGHALPPPEGTTRDAGILLSTLDNRYSLRVNRYESVVKNSSLTASFPGFLLEQSLWVPAVAWADYQSGELTDAELNGYAHLDRIDEIMASHRQFQDDLVTAFPEFVDRWIGDRGQGEWAPSSGSNTTEPTRAGIPTGARATEDSVSKGWEIEFVANPTNNWRIVVNAAKISVVRDNVPGESITRLVEFIDNAYRNTPAGLMPEAAGGDSELLRDRWIPFRAAWTVQQSLNGQEQPETRKWRVNLVTNYKFRDGWLEGFGIGGAYRYESPHTLGYAVITDPDTGAATPDLARPFRSASENRIDLTFSYERKLTDRIDWIIQLNLYNAFGRNKVLPINVQADGTPGAYRIQEGTSWAITNTIRF